MCVRATIRNGPLLLSIIILTFTLRDARCMAEEPPEPKNGQTNATATPRESAEIRFAKAHLRVAQMDLRRLAELQKKHPGVFAGGTAEDLTRHVKIDEYQLDQALKGAEANSHEMYVLIANLAVDYAQNELRRKQLLHQKYDTDLTNFEVERAKSVLQMARAQLEMTNDKKGMNSSMMYLSWQIDLLRNQVLELQTQVNSQFRRDW